MASFENFASKYYNNKAEPLLIIEIHTDLYNNTYSQKIQDK